MIAAPSGAGKTSLVNAMLEHDPRLALSVSHTTRPPRPGERDGEHYHFVDEPAFLALADGDGFLEHAEVFGHRYGTGRDGVDALLSQGRDVLLEIDWQGARQVRERVPECRSVFIVPPSVAALRERLSHRGQDDPAVIAERMKKAHSELSHWAEFDYLVVNDDFDTALADLLAIVRAERLALPRQRRQHAELLAQLLA